MDGVPAKSGRPTIVAHRGGAPDDIENSLAAFTFAIRSGADLIECDLRRSSDGVVVLYHDEKIGRAKVRDLTLSELRARHPELLTLDDLIMFVSGYAGPVGLVLDLKERGIEQALIPRLEQRPDLIDSILVSTVHTRSLLRLSRRFPRLRLALSRGHLISGVPFAGLRGLAARLLRYPLLIWIEPQVRLSRAGTVAMQHRLLNRRFVEWQQRMGREVYAWTVDDSQESHRLAAIGVNAIASNVPAMLVGQFGSD